MMIDTTAVNEIERRNRVLLVDDDASLLRLLTLRLESAGYEVMSVGSGEGALGAVPSFRPDLVVTDLRMAGMNGLTLFERIHESTPQLPVIILTAHGSIPDAVQATRSGVFSFLTKPFDSQHLLEQVKKATTFYGQMNVEHSNTESWREEIISRSLIMEQLLAKARQLAASDASVLIHGESGTGKEVLARAIHKASSRGKGPFVAINCGAIPENLLESEIFGHRKGSFTGAVFDHPGLFVSAQGGTVFLDEIGDMPLSLQVKLLRVLQERQVRPIGATDSIAVDVRIISATHRDLEVEMAASRFREDLFYRLNVVSLTLPTLAERRDDIPLLADCFREKLVERYDKRVTGFVPEAMEMLVSAAWPGNVRELYNVVEQVVALCNGTIIPASLVSQALRNHHRGIISFVDARMDFERKYLTELLQITQGNVTQAARLAQRNRTEFYKLLHRHQLDPALFKQSASS